MTYHGELYGVRELSGRFVRVPRVALGSLRGVGLVTAPDKAALLAGRYYQADEGGGFRPVVQVFYRRERFGPYMGTNWKHDVNATELGSSSGVPVFRFLEGLGVAPAHVCAYPPGEFICDG